jgi:hypothetical protein
MNGWQRNTPVVAVGGFHVRLIDSSRLVVGNVGATRQWLNCCCDQDLLIQSSRELASEMDRCYASQEGGPGGDRYLGIVRVV